VIEQNDTMKLKGIMKIKKKEKKLPNDGASSSSSSSSSPDKVEEEEEEADSDRSNKPSTQADDAILASTTGSNSTVTASNDNTIEVEEKKEEEKEKDHDIKLPSRAELLETLCKLYKITCPTSREKALQKLERMYTLAHTHNTDFLKLFHQHGGELVVLDFLEATMIDMDCVAGARMESIEKAADVIAEVCYSGQDDGNKDIVTKIVTTVMDSGGIDILINASEEYSGGKDVPQLNALAGVWCALCNITQHIDTIENAVGKVRVMVMFDKCMDILFQIKSYNDPIVSEILENVLGTLCNIVDNNCVEKTYFFSKGILPKCLDIFRANETWGDRNEMVTKKAICFFAWCRDKKLLEQASDYEMLLPFLAVCMKKFGSNQQILIDILDLLDGACDTLDNKIITRSGIIEPLGALLTSPDVNEEQKKEVHEVIVAIVAPKKTIF